MVFSRNKNRAVEIVEAAQVIEKPVGNHEPKKIVIIAGPTFGSVLGFLLAGAVLGAAGALYLKRNASTPGTAEDSLTEGLTGGGAKDPSAIAARANALMKRVKSLSNRAQGAVQSLSETVSPAVQDAISEGKSAAAKTERDLKKELHEEI